MTRKEVDQAAQYWASYLRHKDWQGLVGQTKYKSVGCGLVYELPKLGRQNQDICIADMRSLNISEPHYHPDGNYEIYIGLTGKADLYVGRHLHRVVPGTAVVIPPNHVHFAVPDADFVTAAVNLPGYSDENYIVTTKSDPTVGFDLDFFHNLASRARMESSTTG